MVEGNLRGGLRVRKHVLCAFISTSILLSLLIHAYAFTTGMPASLVIGQTDFVSSGFSTTQTGLYNPVRLGFDFLGNLWVADAQNSRVLMFKPPFANGMAASFVIGQTDFTHSSAVTSQTGLDHPYGITFDPSGNLWVADTLNNRVLMFKPPFSNGMAANTVIGQSDFTHNGQATTQTGFDNPSALTFDSAGNLWVSDQENNRVLMFKPPFANGMAASLVIGHKSFSWGGGALNQTGFNWPYDLGFDSAGNLCVADEVNNRILMFKPPFATGMAATLVIGHPDFVTSVPGTASDRLHHPRGLGFDASGNMWVADCANARVLKFGPALATGMAANVVIGQADFTGNAAATTQTGLSLPIGVGFDGVGDLWISDVHDNRVLMYQASSGLTGFLLQFQAGWNLVSLPIAPAQTSIDKLLNPLIQLHELKIVWCYSPTPSPAWSFFTPPSSGALKTMVDGKGYWVYVNDAVNMTVVGYVIPPASTPPSYSLAAGWNLAGFKPEPTIQNETIGQYLMSISGSYDQNNVWIYDNAGGAWIRATSSTWVVPGQAMWILVTSPSGATLRP
jgi:sugar lactone lactonase YvrE